jgi:hypothetical protein
MSAVLILEGQVRVLGPHLLPWKARSLHSMTPCLGPALPAVTLPTMAHLPHLITVPPSHCGPVYPFTPLSSFWHGTSSHADTAVLGSLAWLQAWHCSTSHSWLASW